MTGKEIDKAIKHARELFTNPEMYTLCVMYREPGTNAETAVHFQPVTEEQMRAIKRFLLYKYPEFTFTHKSITNENR